jgi:hypothetical protein
VKRKKEGRWDNLGGIRRMGGTSGILDIFDHFSFYFLFSRLEANFVIVNDYNSSPKPPSLLKREGGLGRWGMGYGI